MKTEDRMLCPRRSEGPAWPSWPKTDRWVRDRWKSRLGRWWEWQFNTGRPLGWLIEKLRLRRYQRIGGTTWRWGWQPRTCSFCGSVHPDDATQLLREGWSIEKAKSYKAYLEPPCTTGREFFWRPLPDWSPVPPVKLYGMHCPTGWRPPEAS